MLVSPPEYVRVITDVPSMRKVIDAPLAITESTCESPTFQVIGTRPSSPQEMVEHLNATTLEKPSKNHITHSRPPGFALVTMPDRGKWI